MDLSKPSHLLGLLTALVIVAGIFIAIFMVKQNKAGTEAGETKIPQTGASPGTGEETTATTETNSAASGAPYAPKNGAIIKTNFGDIEVVFFGADAPKTVENFQKLAESGFYANTKFHRVIKNFMIQGGDPFSKDNTQMARWGTGGPGYTFEDEINAQKVVRGALAMANAGPNTNGSQFFIVTVQATPWLDGLHTVFGQVTRGMDVVDKISMTDTVTNDIPKSPVIIESIILK
ncbi:MAG: Peptidyl-prolyl cis-trans isomerase [Parcubacteria group bacterium GW2011_GWA2_47_64]|nr:MAG: Peptidyl-prolyl cis-trans isomerase [Parcubacteria group bacterium GW2011_GWA2_47_64]KKU96188.1 MAG: Peptidyl-prolyl cis-trans isomerase [Parcubacteria group bacterium GW2011_GWC2_48_17]